jgi:hypothetical protein
MARDFMDVSFNMLVSDNIDIVRVHKAWASDWAHVEIADVHLTLRSREAVAGLHFLLGQLLEKGK